MNYMVIVRLLKNLAKALPENVLVFPA